MIDVTSILNDPCLMCGSKNTCMVIGPPATAKPYRLCWDCFLTTPAGQQIGLANIKSALGPTDDDDDIRTE